MKTPEGSRKFQRSATALRTGDRQPGDDVGGLHRSTFAGRNSNFGDDSVTNVSRATPAQRALPARRTRPGLHLRSQRTVPDPIPPGKHQLQAALDQIRQKAR